MEVLPDHTRLSASGAARWMNCPGSQVLSENLGIEEDESPFAAEGTAAHELAEICLKSGQEAWEFIGEEVYGHEVSEDMSLAVQVYLDYCRTLMQMYPDAEVLIEQRVDNKKLHPDFGGTSDFTLIGDTFIRVVDYKHGVGIAVDAKGNAQAQYYAYGTLKKLPVAQQREIENVYTVIVQPRAFHPEGIVRQAEITAQALNHWGRTDLLPAMKAVDGEDPELNAGEHCRFCPGKIGCPVMKSMFEAAQGNKVEDASVPSDDDLGLEFEMIAPVKMYLNALQAEAFKRAEKGRKIPGGKMVRGRSDRVWNEDSEEAIKEKFGDEAYTEPKLKSPAQVEKLVGGKKFAAANAHKPDGRLSFVPMSHKGREVKVESPSDRFKGIKRATE